MTVIGQLSALSQKSRAKLTADSLVLSRADS